MHGQSGIKVCFTLAILGIGVFAKPQWAGLQHLPNAQFDLDEVDDLYNRIEIPKSLEQEEEQLWPELHEVHNWVNPADLAKMGQISGVAVDIEGNPVILHRGSHTWDEETFNDSNIYQHIEKGPISVDTVLTLDKKTGKIIKSWGKNKFYLPHGLTIDQEGNLWITDVALHQVFKFAPNSNEPLLTLGEKFKPGEGPNSFCQPSSVAVTKNGQFFIADGYCNSRIIKYSPKGNLLTEWGNNKSRKTFRVAHGLYLDEAHDEICAADREHMRIMCYTAGNRLSIPGKFRMAVENPALGRLFALTGDGDFLYAVSGPTAGIKPQGYTIDGKTGDILDIWNSAKGFGNPHAIAISPDGEEMYVAQYTPNAITKFVFKRAVCEQC